MQIQYKAKGKIHGMRCMNIFNFAFAYSVCDFLPPLKSHVRILIKKVNTVSNPCSNKRLFSDIVHQTQKNKLNFLDRLTNKSGRAKNLKNPGSTTKGNKKTTAHF
jgi:hypothetical protein